MSKKEEALGKAFPNGFSLQKDEHTFAVAGDEKGKFFVGLSDILQALAFAEDEADVPEIPQDLCEEIGKLYSAEEIWMGLSKERHLISQAPSVII